MSHRATDRFENWFITSLQTDINDTTTSFRLNKALNVRQGRLVIDPYDETKREIVKVTSVDGNLVYVERGNDNTAPEYHNEGTIVAMHVFAADLNDLYADFAGVVDDMAAAARSVLSPELQFSGGKVGVGKIPENGALDVDGDIYSNGVKVLDENYFKPVKTTVSASNVTWVKRVFPDGRILYSTRHQFTGSAVGANGWNQNISFRLPDNITFNPSTMIFDGTAIAWDAALTANIGILGGDNTVVVMRTNAYGQSISTGLFVTARLEIFPE